MLVNELNLIEPFKSTFLENFCEKIHPILWGILLQLKEMVSDELMIWKMTIGMLLFMIFRYKSPFNFTSYKFSFKIGFLISRRKFEKSLFFLCDLWKNYDIFESYFVIARKSIFFYISLSKAPVKRRFLQFFIF